MSEHEFTVLDATSGERLWTGGYFDRDLAGPVVVGDVVVAGESPSVGYRLNGDQIWSHEEPAFRPLTAANGVVVGTGDREGAGVAAVDPEDGSVSWGVTPDPWPSGRTDAARDAVTAGSAVVAAHFDGPLAGVVAGGEVRWTVDDEWDTHGPGRPSLASAGEAVVAASGAIARFDPSTGERRWRRVLPDYATDVTVVDGTVVVTVEGDTPKVDSWDEPGGVLAYDLATGNERWRTPLDVPATTVGTGLGAVVVGTKAGTLVGPDRDDGAVQWRRQVGDGVQTPPVGRSDRLFVGVRRDGSAAVVRLGR